MQATSWASAATVHKPKNSNKEELEAFFLFVHKYLIQLCKCQSPFVIYFGGTFKPLLRSEVGSDEVWMKDNGKWR